MGDLRTFFRLTPSTLTPLTADPTSPATTTRSQTSLVVARATCSLLRARPASQPRRSPSAGAGTPVLRTATVRTTAMLTAPVRSCKTPRDNLSTITPTGSGLTEHNYFSDDGFWSGFVLK